MRLFCSLFVLLCACTHSPLQPDLPPLQPLSYLALGDSYTIGEGIAANGRWPVLLADSLRLSGYEMPPPQLIARTGWTTAELKAAIAAGAPPDTFGLVSLLIGVNNQFRNQAVGLYRQEFEELLQTAIRLAAGDTGRVFVLSIPDYGVTPFGASRNPSQIARDIDAYNLVAEGICRRYGIPFVDITPISRLAANDLSLLAPDRLHPSEKMYRQWVRAAFPEIIRLLK